MQRAREGVQLSLGSKGGPGNRPKGSPVSHQRASPGWEPAAGQRQGPPLNLESCVAGGDVGAEAGAWGCYPRGWVCRDLSEGKVALQRGVSCVGRAGVQPARPSPTAGRPQGQARHRPSCPCWTLLSAKPQGSRSARGVLAERVRGTGLPGGQREAPPSAGAGCPGAPAVSGFPSV